MLGTITNQTGNTNRQVFTEIKSLERKIDGLETQVNNIQTEVDSFDNNITTENLNSTNIISQSINTNTILGNSISSETLTSDSIISDNITSDNINADSITAESITSDEIHGQIKDRQSTITSDTGNITTLDSEDIDVDLLKAKAATITELTLEDSLNTTDVTATNVNTDNITGTNGNITTLQSTTATIDEITNTSITSHTATIDSIDVEEAEIDEANIDYLKSDEVESAVITGKEVINLDPQKITEQDYYLLKIKKGFDSLHLFVEDSLDINIINAYSPSNTTDGTPLVISHCNTVSEIVLYSKDDDYYYIEISPNNTNELHYSYKAHSKIENLITATLNEEVEFDWYYKTERTSEIIFLGSAGEEERFNYQFTILGKLNALVSPTFENTVFDDITVNKNIYTKDYFNEDSQEWAYKKGEVNDYLSNIEDYIDEETGEQKTRIDWRKRVAFRNPNQYIVTTEDSKEDVLVDGTKIGERVVKANVNTLMDLGTLRNYNGQWVTEEPEPADTHDFSFNSDSNPETLVAGFGFLGTPEITESDDKVYPEEQYSWKKWDFAPTDSYTIYTTNTEDYLFEEIRTLFVKHYIGDSSEIIIAGTNSNYDSFSLSENIDYSIVATSSMKQVAKISAIGKSEEEFRNSLLATGLFDENLHPTQTIFLDDGGRQMAFDTSVYLSLSEDGPVYFDVNTSNDRFSFNGTTFLSILETTPAETHNFTYIESQDPETVAEGFDFLGTPVIEENSGYPEADLSQKIWTFTPADSWTIFSTDNDYMFYAEIKDLMVESTKDGSLITTVSIETDSVYTGLIQGVGYTIVPTSSIKSVATINVEGMSKDDFKSTLLATGLFNEVEGELHPTQAVFLRDEEEYTYAFGTEAELYFREGESYFSVFVNENEFTYTVTTISTLETTPEPTPTTKVNPITKLGVVDEGTWVAGDVTTPNLKVNESTELNKTTTINDDLHITEKVLDFGGTNYDVWDYANDNMNWVEE